MGFMTDNFTLTAKGIDDLLDRLKRFVGRTAYEPTIREASDLGDVNGYLNVMLHGAQAALKGTRKGERELDENTIVTTNKRILGSLNSKKPISQLTQEQRKKIASLLEISNELILKDQED